MPCARAFNPADHNHAPREKAAGYAARLSIVATLVGKSKSCTAEHPDRVEKIQPPLPQGRIALCRVEGNFHYRIVYTNNRRVTVFRRADKVIE